MEENKNNQGLEPVQSAVPNQVPNTVANQGVVNTPSNAVPTGVVQQAPNTASVQQTVNPAPQPAPATNTVQPKQPTPAAQPQPEEPKKGGKLKVFLLIILFLLLWAVAFFLPDITQYLESLNDSGATKEITSGTLVCKYENKSQSGTKEIDARFTYKAKKLKRVDMTIVTTNDDQEKIKSVMEKCEQVEHEVLSLNGIEIKCNESDNKIIQTEKVNYELFDPKGLTPAFSEAGGTYPEFDFNENIDKVQKEMIKSQYSCNKRN